MCMADCHPRNNQPLAHFKKTRWPHQVEENPPQDPTHGPNNGKANELSVSYGSDSTAVSEETDPEASRAVASVLQAQLQSSYGQIQDLTNTVAELRYALNRAIQENADLTQRYTVDKTRLKSQITELTGEVRNQKENVRSEKSVASAEKANIRRTNEIMTSSMKICIKDLQKEIRDKELLIRQLEKKVKNFTAAIEAANGEKHKTALQLVGVTREVASLRKENNKLKKKIETLEKKTDSATLEKLKISKEMAEIEAKKSVAKLEYEKERSKNNAEAQREQLDCKKKAMEYRHQMSIKTMMEKTSLKNEAKKIKDEQVQSRADQVATRMYQSGALTGSQIRSGGYFVSIFPSPSPYPSPQILTYLSKPLPPQPSTQTVTPSQLLPEADRPIRQKLVSKRSHSAHSRSAAWLYPF